LAQARVEFFQGKPERVAAMVVHFKPFIASFVLSALSTIHAEDTQIEVYFGAGCFWHIQHVFIEAEKRILGRDGATLTALTGYAGHSKKGTACYMDEKVSAEVVGMKIPQSSLAKFAEVYFGTFVGLDRSHTGDRGPHYRAVIGLPGGLWIRDGSSSQKMNPLFAHISNATTAKFEFKTGHGDDADTLFQPWIWVYDSNNKFPFNQAEIYHQFHDDYLPGGDYGVAYEDLRATLTCQGILTPTGCKNDSPKDIGASLKCKTVKSNDAKNSSHNTGGSGGDALQSKDNATKKDSLNVSNDGGSGGDALRRPLASKGWSSSHIAGVLSIAVAMFAGFNA